MAEAISHGAARGIPTESGFVGVEGVRMVEEALRSGCRIEAVLFSETGARYRERLAPFLGGRKSHFQCSTTDRFLKGGGHRTSARCGCAGEAASYDV